MTQKKKQWFEKLTREKRIELAKSKMIRIVDHFLYLIELHANNSYVVYSPTLSSQIPTSFAASAFNVFQRSMYQIEIVRLCALWDSVDPEKENIPTVIALIDDDTIIEALAEKTRSFWADHVGGTIINPSDDAELAELEQEALKQSNIQYGAEQASSAKIQLREAISDVRAVFGSVELSSLMNVRDKHIAHSLTETHREKRGPVPPMKTGGETTLMKRSIPIIEHLYCWINGIGFSIDDSQRIDRENAEALWTGCKFTVLR